MGQLETKWKWNNFTQIATQNSLQLEKAKIIFLKPAQSYMKL
jgi:hypothetical protein